jgi:type IV pilus assembly protein PilC
MLFLKKNIKPAPKVLLFRQLSYLLTPDYPPLKAIEFLRDDLDDKKLDKILLSMQQDFERGLSFADSVEKYPQLFTDSEIKLIEIGEKEGTLTKIFESLADDNERQDFVRRLWRKLFKSALAYIVPAMLIIFFYTNFVMPVYLDMFSSMGGNLPIMTLIVVEASKNWIFLLYFIILIGFIAYMRKHISYAKSAFDVTIIHLPIVGSLYKQIAVDKLVRTLAILISNKKEAGESVRVAAMSLDNNFLRKKVLKFSELADIENRASAALRQCKFIPRRLIRIIATSEEKDYDPAILEFARNYYADNTLESIINAQEKLQILMRIFFGFVIGVLVIALYLPIFSMATLS